MVIKNVFKNLAYSAMRNDETVHLQPHGYQRWSSGPGTRAVHKSSPDSILSTTLSQKLASNSADSTPKNPYLIINLDKHMKLVNEDLNTCSPQQLCTVIQLFIYLPAQGSKNWASGQVTECTGKTQPGQDTLHHRDNRKAPRTPTGTTEHSPVHLTSTSGE